MGGYRKDEGISLMILFFIYSNLGYLFYFIILIEIIIFVVIVVILKIIGDIFECFILVIDNWIY